VREARVRRKGWLIAGALVLVLVVAAGFAWRRFAPYPQVGSVYLAEQMCACVFVANRSEPSCRAEFEPDIKKFDVKVSRTGSRDGLVQTRLLVFRGEARFEPPYGCRITR
jgi:hypothetical protein